MDVFAADYDARTALHLAAAEGRKDVLAFLLGLEDAAAHVSSPDRWGGTPLDDATRHGSSGCEQLLRSAGAVAGTAIAPQDQGQSQGPNHARVAEGATELLHAAADGNLNELVQMAAQGKDLAS